MQLAGAQGYLTSSYVTLILVPNTGVTPVLFQWDFLTPSSTTTSYSRWKCSNPELFLKEHEPWLIPALFLLILASLVQEGHQDPKLVLPCSSSMSRQLRHWTCAWGKQDHGWECQQLPSAWGKPYCWQREEKRLSLRCKSVWDMQVLLFPAVQEGQCFKTTAAPKTTKSPCSLWWIHMKLLKTRPSHPHGQEWTASAGPECSKHSICSGPCWGKAVFALSEAGPECPFISKLSS